MAIIEVKNFHKGFGKKSVHEGVSLYVKKGECLGLVGGSGTGKSVLLRSLIGLEKADKGEIFIEDINVTDFSERQWQQIRKKVAYAFQGGALFDSMTVFQNLAYPLKEHTKLSEEEIRHKISSQLKDFGLEGSEKLYPNELSGGMQKRVGLARAMMLEPDIILYDEPTAGLDPYNTRNIQELILNLKKKGVTSILVTHDMPTAFAVCDKFAFLKDKVIKEQGTAEQLKNQSDSLIHQFIQGNIL
ncbi:MAG: ABC-type organic solvent resistance transport system ATP-binding protein [Pseudobdellovibrio sp.]|jgi:phospholipid/cholesterol/gamma-HCH transport system ATP-binding protein|nr:ABC-type organic solvent resistance transport system ATP-binding protein [Pseudobdellovibrio sp.]